MRKRVRIFYYLCTMEKYIKFIDATTDFIIVSSKNFIGAEYLTTTTIALYFGQAPLSREIVLNHGMHQGPQVLQNIAELFLNSPKKILQFDDINNIFDCKLVTGISINKIVAQ